MYACIRCWRRGTNPYFVWYDINVELTLYTYIEFHFGLEPWQSVFRTAHWRIAVPVTLAPSTFSISTNIYNFCYAIRTPLSRLTIPTIPLLPSHASISPVCPSTTLWMYRFQFTICVTEECARLVASRSLFVDIICFFFLSTSLSLSFRCVVSVYVIQLPLQRST